MPIYKRIIYHGDGMNSMTTQQQPKDILKIVFLFAALGVSAYVTYRISRSLAREITNEIA